MLYHLERLKYELVSISRHFQQKKIFIHIPKAAGMSIRRSQQLAGRIMTVKKHRLINREYAQNLHKKMEEIGDHHGFEHARYIDVKKQLRSNHGAFAVVRNPWDRVASRYFFAKQVIEIEKKYIYEKHNIASFEEFLEERHIWGNEKFLWHRAIRGWYPCRDYVIDEKGEIAVDILRFESLDSDIKHYFNLKNDHKPRNVTKARNMSLTELYTPKTIQIVADWYKADIEMFGYDFDGGATKNTMFTS